MSWIRRYAHVPIATLLILSLWMELAAEVRSAEPAQGDEVNWITSGARTFDLVRRGAGPAEWESSDTQRWIGSFGNMNPPVGKWLIGAFLALGSVDEPIDFRWNFKKSLAENRKLNNIPPRRIVFPARMGVTVLAALTLALVYVCAVQITGARWLALTAPLFLFSFHVFRFHATRVYTDVPQLCFLLGAIVAFNAYLAGRGKLTFAAATVLVGLATAIKFSAAPIVLSMGVLALFYPGSAWQRLGRGALAGIVPVAVFVAVNPYLYPDPLGRSLHTLSLWSDLYSGLVHNPTFSRQVVESPIHGLWLVFLRSVADPWIYEPVHRAVAPWILPVIAAITVAVGLLFVRKRARLRAGCFSPRIIATVGLSALAAAAQALIGVGAWVGLFALGIAQTLLPGAASRKNPPVHPRVFVVTAWALTWIMTGAWLALDWNRYYLRSLTLSAVFFAAGLAWIASLVEVGSSEAKSSTPESPATPG